MYVLLGCLFRSCYCVKILICLQKNTANGYIIHFFNMFLCLRPKIKLDDVICRKAFYTRRYQIPYKPSQIGRLNPNKSLLGKRILQQSIKYMERLINPTIQKQTFGQGKQSTDANVLQN